MGQHSEAVRLNISGQGTHYGDFQNEIYAAGLRGTVPSFPVSARMLEAQAVAAMPPLVLSYVQGGCGDEFTQQQNVEAFNHWGLIPRMMVDCTRRDMSIDLFGLKLPTPLFMCPIGVIGICAQDGRGDIHTARAAQITKIPMVASTLSNDPLETVADTIGDTVTESSSFTRRRKDPWLKAWFIGPKKPVSRRLLSHSTPGPLAGGRAISAPQTSLNCAGTRYLTIFRTPTSGRCLQSRLKRTLLRPSCDGRASSEKT